MTQLTVTNRQGYAPATITEAMEFSKMLADSSMVPKAYQGKPMDVLVCVQWGAEIGLAPMQALQNIAVINGKPSVYGDAAMALVQTGAVFIAVILLFCRVVGAVAARFGVPAVIIMPQDAPAAKIEGTRRRGPHR